MKHPENFDNFINERKDYVGSRIKFLEGEEESEQDGKVVMRKKDGRVLIMCLSGRNKGNTKLVTPEQITYSSAERNTVT